MIIVVLILLCSTLTAQSRDDRIKEVIGNYVTIISNQSNVISKIEYELYTTSLMLTNSYMVLETEREIKVIDIKLEKIKSSKKMIIGAGIGATAVCVIGALLRYTFYR